MMQENTATHREHDSDKMMGATAYQNAIDEAVANHSAHYED